MGQVVGRSYVEMGIWTRLWHRVELGTGPGGGGWGASSGLPHQQVCPCAGRESRRPLCPHCRPG